ncbi:MAG: 50S ribosomal protein L11 [Nanoarchaeota archaeon]
MIVKLIVEGGDMKPGPVVAQQIGPLGINLGKVIDDVNTATAEFKGTKVPIEIDVDAKTKSYRIKVFSPPVAELIKKELGLEKGSGAAGNIKVGNISFERIVALANTKHSSLLAKEFKSAVKLIVGTCVSLGVLIDNKEAKLIEKDIVAGKYDKEINEKITNPSPEKVKQLSDFYAILKEKQDKELKALADVKAAEEAAKAAATASAPAAGVAATTASAAPAVKKEEVKKEDKKKK